MKNTFLISLICLLTGSIYGQSYQPILGEKNEWSVNTFGPGLSNDILFVTGEDTLIDSIRYFPLIRKAPPSSPYPDRLMGYLKEDSIEQSISIIEVDINGIIDWTIEKLLFRFDLQVGDTVIIHSQDYYPSGLFYQDTLTVESIEYQISTVNCNEYSYIRDSVKLINLNSIRVSAWLENTNITWIEGTGPASFITLSAFNACGTSINCHHKNDLLLYQSLRAQQLDTCLLSTELDQIQQDLRLSLSPNPATHQITLNYDNPHGEERKIILRNLQGQSLWTERSRAEKINIKRQNWAAGIYFLEFYADNKPIGRSKIIFQ